MARAGSMHATWALAALACAAVVGCGGAGNSCAPVACACSDGKWGTRACASDGTLTGCSCPQANGGNAVPIELQNAASHITRQVTCGAPPVACADYEITFVLQANMDIHRIDTIRVTMGGEDYSSAIACDLDPWQSLAASGPAPSVKLVVQTGGTNGAFEPRITVPCGDGTTELPLSGLQTAAQTTGALGVLLNGSLATGDRFEAGGDAPLR